MRRGTRESAVGLKLRWLTAAPALIFGRIPKQEPDIPDSPVVETKLILWQMNVSGPNLSKLKQLVIEKWQSGPELWPVKAISLMRLGELQSKNDGQVNVGGYFTCLRAVRGRTPEEMADLLGFARDYLCSGVAILKFVRLPEPEEFELKGYSQTPEGKPFDGFVLRKAGQQRPEYTDKNGNSLTFIPGLAVEQWTIRSGLELPTVLLERVMPGLRFTKWR